MSGDYDGNLLTSLLKRGGFDLTKWKIPHRQLHDETARQDLDLDETPIERALGVCWDVQQDKLVFKVTRMEKPCTSGRGGGGSTCQN